MKRYTIMVQLGIDDPAKPLLDFTWQLSDRFDLDIIGFSAADVGLIVPGDVDGSTSAEAMQMQMEMIDKQLKALEAQFHEAARNHRRASWRSAVADPTRELTLYARAADLILVKSPRPDLFAGGNQAVDHGALILAAGRPVLLASDSLTAMKAEHVLVAWKDTREARRAVADALPFLVQAKEVLVATLDEREVAQSREGVDDVKQYLLKHGVKARSELIDLNVSDAGEALAEIAREIGADLIVAGGYGHSRLREWAFGA